MVRIPTLHSEEIALEGVRVRVRARVRVRVGVGIDGHVPIRDDEHAPRNVTPPHAPRLVAPRQAHHEARCLVRARASAMVRARAIG